ncbi:MAG: DUF1190 domain-containing protein [Alphaproteobacteria bacterium]
MKRSSRIRLLVMGTATLAMVACDGDTPQQAGVYASVEECVSGGIYSETFCREHLEQAKKEHMKVAPKYAKIEDCEAEFGRGRCERPPSSGGAGVSGGESGSGSFFMPLMMGYLVGKALNGGGGYGQPLYRPNTAPTGGFGYSPGTWRTAGNVEVAKNTGATSVPSSVFRSGGNTSSTHTSTVARGGFGARASSVGSSGS